MATTAQAPALSRDQLLKLYRDMLTQRAVDTRGFQLNRQGKIGIAMGSEGHEAVQAGTGLAFERGKDLLYPYYRNTGIILACGFPLVDLFRSQLARAKDTTGGRSIINHVTARELGIASISSIIAAQCTHAVGAAWAIKRSGATDRVVFCQFGDGATSQGEWHEAMNFAAVHALPVVFLCENNQWAISTHISKQMRVPTVATRAAGYGDPRRDVRRLRPDRRLHDGARRARARRRRQRPRAGRVDVLPLPLAHDGRRRPHLPHARRGLDSSAPTTRCRSSRSTSSTNGVLSDDDVKAIRREITKLVNAPPTKSKRNRTPRRARSTATPTPARTTPGSADGIMLVP